MGGPLPRIYLWPQRRIRSVLPESHQLTPDGEKSVRGSFDRLSPPRLLCGSQVIRRLRKHSKPDVLVLVGNPAQDLLLFGDYSAWIFAATRYSSDDGRRSLHLTPYPAVTAYPERQRLFLTCIVTRANWCLGLDRNLCSPSVFIYQGAAPERSRTPFDHVNNPSLPAPASVPQKFRNGFERRLGLSPPRLLRPSGVGNVGLLAPPGSPPIWLEILVWKLLVWKLLKKCGGTRPMSPCSYTLSQDIFSASDWVISPATSLMATAKMSPVQASPADTKVHDLCNQEFAPPEVLIGLAVQAAVTCNNVCQRALLRVKGTGGQTRCMITPRQVSSNMPNQVLAL
ncbi:hypothetical protein QBC35DRAFT_471487 [Podospora australis]|uniref:Uncharacterized protein n=1 Tax=Podospora australis TaxID=1536484 RepID=A0AAN6X0X4_9PEZI|nr:hypothetical protein QBC35DRAFT_471487 [Podospora australis]